MMASTCLSRWPCRTSSAEIVSEGRGVHSLSIDPQPGYHRGQSFSSLSRIARKWWKTPLQDGLSRPESVQVPGPDRLAASCRGREQACSISGGGLKPWGRDAPCERA